RARDRRRPRDRLLRDGRRGRRGRRRARHHPPALPDPRHGERRRGDDAAMVTPEPLLRWIVLLPALGFLWNATIGQRASRSAAVVGPGAVGGAFVVALLTVARLHRLDGEAPILHDAVYRWITVGTFHADVAFRLDAISAIMVLVVTGVGFLIHV